MDLWQKKYFEDFVSTDRHISSQSFNWIKKGK